MCKECQIPERLRRYLIGKPWPKDHKEDPSTDGRITSNRTFAKCRSETGQLAPRIERNGRRRSLRRPKLSALKESSAPGRRRTKVRILITIQNQIKTALYHWCQQEKFPSRFVIVIFAFRHLFIVVWDHNMDVPVISDVESIMLNNQNTQYWMLVGKPEGRRHRKRHEDKIKTNLKPDWKAWTGMMWLRAGTSGKLLSAR